MYLCHPSTNTVSVEAVEEQLFLNQPGYTYELVVDYSLDEHWDVLTTAIITIIIIIILMFPRLIFLIDI